MFVHQPIYPALQKKFIYREILQNSAHKYPQFYDGGISSGLNGDKQLFF
jgi:hypothetical protein